MTETTGQRQLLAIMFTDVVGYTALTERNEATAVRVREQHRDLVRTLVKQFDGELVDATGDESFSIFPSALRAVDCALAVQGALRSYPDLRVRIGIHLGDVLRHEGEVVGEGVNVAARVRPLAEPGGICVSEPVFQMVRSRAHVRGRALGSQNLQNVGQPLAVYALSTGEDAPTAPAPKSRRWLWAGLLAATVVAAAIGFSNRGALVVWLALNGPRFFGDPIEQQIGFTEASDGVRIAYATSGAGPPLVFVLGWATHLTEGIASPLYDRAGVLGFLSRKYLYVRYDGRGFGLSDRDVDDYSLDARLRDLEAVVGALGLERFAIQAVSAGGPTAIAYTARNPERVSHLILAGAVTRGTRSADTERIRSALQLFRTSWDTPMARAAMVEMLAPEADEVGRSVLMHFLDVSADGHSVAGFFEAMLAIDTSDEARRIRTPTLVIAGSADSAVPVSETRRLASLIPGARFEILEGASHVEATGGDPRVMQMIAEFLSD